MFKQGNSVKYFRFMQRTYGEDVIAELERLDTENKQFTPQELKDLIETLKQKINEIPHT